MKKTVKLFGPERYVFADGTVLERDEVTVTQFGKADDDRTVWADVDDDSCLYIIFHGKLWKHDGYVY